MVTRLPNFENLIVLLLFLIIRTRVLLLGGDVNVLLIAPHEPLGVRIPGMLAIGRHPHSIPVDCENRGVQLGFPFALRNTEVHVRLQIEGSDQHSNERAWGNNRGVAT